MSIKALEARIVEAERKYETLRLAALDWGNGIDTHSRLIDKLWQRVEALEAGATCPHVRSSDEGTSYCALAESGAAQQPPLFTAEEVARIVAPTVKKSLTDSAGSLVERVAWLIAKRFSESRPGTDCLPFGRDVILEVAAWLRSEYPRREGYGTAWANLIEQEANR